jgi:hypothetical protein
VFESSKAPLKFDPLRRSLRPILAELQAEKTGVYAMRRFCTTWL